MRCDGSWSQNLCSLDGVIEDPGGAEGTRHGGWSFKFNDPDGMKYKLDETLEHDALLLRTRHLRGIRERRGRAMTDDVGFADKMNWNAQVRRSARRFGTRRLEQLDRVCQEMSAREVSALKEQPGGDILVAGSATLVRELLDRGLADEYRLMVFPVVLGSGKRLFGGEGDAAPLKLVDVKPARPPAR